MKGWRWIALWTWALVLADAGMALAQSAQGSPAMGGSPGWVRFLSWLFQIEVEDLERKLWRVVLALGIGLSAKFFMDLVQWASRLLIRSNWRFLD